MRKIIIVSGIILICVILSFYYAYSIYSFDKKQISKFNYFFEQYQDKIIEGTELATIINRVMDENEKNKSEPSKIVKLEIHIMDNDTTYQVEQIYQLGTERFVSNFNTEKFSCKEISYQKETKMVNYICFEQKL